MRFKICCGTEQIGTSAFEERDPDMGTMAGAFVPSPAYEQVRSVFRLFSDAQSDTGPHDKELIERYYRERDRLDLSVTSPFGTRIPTSVVHISDFAEGPNDDSYEVEVHVSDPSFFESFPVESESSN